MIRFDQRNDQSGQPALALYVPDVVHHYVLLAGVSKQITKPTGGDGGVMVFNATGDFYLSRSGSVTIPVGDAVIDCGELNPAARALENPAPDLFLIAEADCRVTVSFYAR